MSDHGSEKGRDKCNTCKYMRVRHACKRSRYVRVASDSVRPVLKEG